MYIVHTWQTALHCTKREKRVLGRLFSKDPQSLHFALYPYRISKEKQTLAQAQFLLLYIYSTDLFWHQMCFKNTHNVKFFPLLSYHNQLRRLCTVRTPHQHARHSTVDASGSPLTQASSVTACLEVAQDPGEDQVPKAVLPQMPVSRCSVFHCTSSL
jgi:hypothetical protein